jgi:hypothetical protein
MCQEASAIFLGGVEPVNQFVVRLQTRNPALDLTRGDMFP